MDDRSLLLQRLHQLESELDEIRLQLEPPKSGRFRLYVVRPCKVMLANWTLLAFVVGLIIALGVYWRYGISYFESQKSASLTKQSADSYRVLGDRLLLYGEFDAARDAYSTALKINSSNVDATRGLLTTQVFQPLEGQKYFIPEIVSLKINYLKELVQRDEQSGLLGYLGLLKPRIENEQGYIVDYFEGALSQQRAQLSNKQEDYDKATASFRTSVQKNNKFIYGYISLAVIQYLGQDFDGAIGFLKQAQQQDHNSAMVLNDLGACYFIKGDFKEAKEQFEASNTISPSFLSATNLAEAYRNLGDAQEAIKQDQFGLQLVKDNQNEKERVLGGQFVSSFLPEKRGAKPPAYYQNIYDLEQKRIMVSYALSLDYALAEDFLHADEAWAEATKRDSEHGFNQYVANRILALEHFSGLALKASTLSWMENARKGLAPL